MNEGILADTPLENPKEDSLGYAPFAKNLTDTLCKMTADECLVFALFGSWGSGKTTCLNFVLSYLNERPEEQKPLIVRFNPWWFSGHGESLKQFFREVRISLGKEEKFKGVIKLLADFSEVISEIPEPTGVAKGGKVLSWILKRLSKNKELWELRNQICENIRRQNRRIIVIVDDIDRLTAEEIRNLFRVIKAVADFPRTIYLLAFDKNIVTEALSNSQGTSGEDYLEKIVQVPFHLPIPDKVALRKFFLEQLDIVLLGTPEKLFDETYWGNVFLDGIDHFLNTMRDVKRLINAIRVTYPSVKGEVNPVDFIAIKTIEVFSSSIYQIIRSNPNMFAGLVNTYGGSTSQIEDIKPFYDKCIAQIAEKDRETVKKILIRIFPKVKSSFENISYGAEMESTWTKQLRICSPEKFPIYFRYAVTEGQISHSEMEANLALAKNTEAFSNKLLELSLQHRPDGSTRVSAFLERLQDYTREDIPEDNIPAILQTLFNVGDELLVPEDDGRGLFGLGNDTRIGRIMFQLLKRYESQDERFRVLKEVFSNGRAVSKIADEVGTLGQQHGKYKSQADPDSECLISAQHVEELEKIALQKIKQAVLNGKLLNIRKLAGILYRWRDWEDEDSVRKWVAKVIGSDKGLVDFLAGFLSKSYSQGMEDRVGREHWQLDPKSIEHFTNPSKLIQRCKNLLESSPEWLKDRKKIAVETFVKRFELQAQGKNPAEE